MHRFIEIESLTAVSKYVQFTLTDPDCPERYKIRGLVSYRGTVKLHGTNAGVACTSEGIVPQSRSRTLTIDDDHEGFAKFISQGAQTKAIREIERVIRDSHGIADDEAVYFYGEWCGKGIMKGVAINQLPTKQWVLFSVRVVSDRRDCYLDALAPLEDKHAETQIFSVLDVPSWSLEIDFGDPSSKQRALDRATGLTAEVEGQCPWGAKFGISGIGEGIVWTPLGEYLGRKELFFKTKGDKHKKVKSKQAPKIDPEILDGITSFIDFAVTDGRLEQGLYVLKEQGYPVDMRSTGHFLKWLNQDVARECRAELEASGLDWKQVQGAIQVKARDFFKRACETI